jgi:hypothetical protein
MSHLRLVPPLPASSPDEVASGAQVPAQRTPYGDKTEALAFFQAASGVCLCRECSKTRHPAYGVL